MIWISFSKWSSRGGSLFLWKRIYWRGFKWTPFVVGTWRYLHWRYIEEVRPPWVDVLADVPDQTGRTLHATPCECDLCRIVREQAGEAGIPSWLAAVERQTQGFQWVKEGLTVKPYSLGPCNCWSCRCIRAGRKVDQV